MDRKAIARARLEKLRMQNAENKALRDAAEETKKLVEQQAVEEKHLRLQLASAKAEAKKLADQRAEVEQLQRQQREAIEAAQDEDLKIVEERVRAEEKKLKAMEDMQEQANALAEKRATMEKANRTTAAETALSEVRIREEIEYIERLERETNQLAQRRAELEARRNRETAALEAAARPRSPVRARVFVSVSSVYKSVGASKSGWTRFCATNRTAPSSVPCRQQRPRPQRINSTRH